MADENPYRKSMSPEDLAARQALLEQQNQYRLMQSQMRNADVEEQIRQRFADIPANQKPRLSSSFMSDDTYAPTLSQYVGGVSISPAIQDIERQAQQKDMAISNLRSMYKNISRLAPDEDSVREELDKYKQSIEELAGSKDRHAYQKAAILGEQFAQDLNSNRNKLGAAYSNYKAKLAHEEMLKKLLEKGQKDGGISPEDYNMAIKISDAEYAKRGGIGKGENNIYNSYSPVMPATYVDQNKVMNDAIANWNKDGRAWTVGGAVVDGKIVGQKYVNGVEGYIIKGTRNGKDTFISADEVRKNLAPVLGNDSMLQSYYKWQAKVNDFGTSDEGIVKFGQSTLNAIVSDINKDKNTLASLEKLGKSKENIQKIENIKNRIAQNTNTADNYAKAAEKALTGDLTPLREIRQSELTSKYNRDLVNLGTAKTDFLDQERSNTIDVSADANYAEGQRIKNMVGNQILKQNGQLVAQPRFKNTSEFGDYIKASNDQLLDMRKQLSTLIGDSEPNIMKWDMATVKAKLDEYANKSLLTYTGSDKDKYSFAHSSAFKNLKSAFDETYQKQQYANQRYENAKAQVLKEHPELVKQLQEENQKISNFNDASGNNLFGIGGASASGEYSKSKPYKAVQNQLDKYIGEKLATSKPLPSQSMMFPELRKGDGQIDYKSSVGLRDVVKEFVGTNGKTDKDGNITLDQNSLLNMNSIAVKMEGQDFNGENTSLQEALKLGDADTSKPIQLGVNQLSFNVLTGDIVIPVRYTVSNTFGKDQIVEKDLHISTDESTGFTNEWLKNFRNSPDMKAKKSYTQALAEQQSGIATPEQYQGAVKYDLDNQKVIINYGNKEVTYGLNEGLQQVSNLEKELNKLLQK